MNHQRVYDWLIARASRRQLEGYCEQHHVYPRCLGGTDEESNLIMLTAREHFLAHLLLAKIHGGKGLWFAILRMKHGAKTARLYEIARVGSAKIAQGMPRTQETKDKISNSSIGAPKSQSHRDALSSAVRLAMNRPEMLTKLRDAHTGVSLSQTHRTSIAESLRAAMNRPETRAKLSASAKARWARRKTTEK